MSGAYDRDRLVELFGDDSGTLADVEREFLDMVRAAEREISGTDDLAAVARAAHRLKGASGVIGAAAADDRPGVRRLGVALREEVHLVADQVRAERSAVVRA